MMVRSPSALVTRELASAVGALLEPGDVVVLAGDLGSGKTTFAQGVAAGLGVAEHVTSPSFTIVQEYDGRVPVAHVDVYRLDRFQELHDLGLDELLEERVTLIEWGDVVAPALPASYVVVRLALGDGDDDRIIAIETHGPGWSTRLERLESAVAAFAAEEA
jgi:tRNA threonylcarbamoyladenosine biosynthesis protein TsaE